MVAAAFEFRADAEARFGFDGPSQIGFVAAQPVQRQIENGHFYAASDVHTNRIRNDGVVCREDATDGQAVTHMRIGHKRRSNGDRQLAGIFHLLECVGVQVRAPLATGNGMFRLYGKGNLGLKYRGEKHEMRRMRRK